MNEPLTLFPPEPPDSRPVFPEDWREDARRSLRRRLLALLAAGGAVFALTTWTLVRFPNPFAAFGLDFGPSDVVKAHLEALNRGELRAAYALFSPRYRQEVSFEAFRRLVVTHRRMFRTRELEVSRQQESEERAVLETHLLSEAGERYRARFTLVHAEGRWWIDDLRWGAESGRKSGVTV